MTEEDKEKMLLEERYATLRTEVRDKNEEYRILQSERLECEAERTCLCVKRHWYSVFTDRKIRKLSKKIDSLDDQLFELMKSLEPLSIELDEVEGKLGVRASELYGREGSWWIRT